MKTEDVMVKCKKCNGLAPASQMKLDIEFGKMICPDCIKSKSKKKDESKQVPVSDKIHYVCKSCDYKFARSKDIANPNNCPYCGKPTIDVEKQ